jgi:hypothetical protein
MPDGMWPRRWPGQIPPGYQALELNPWHPLVASIRGAWVLGRGTPVNLVTGEVATVGVGAPESTIGPLGPSYSNAGAARNGWQVRNGPILAGRSVWTVAAVCMAPASSTGSANGRPIYCERAAASGNDIFKLSRADGSRHDVTFTYRNTAGTLSNPGTAVNDMRTGRAFVAGASMSPGGASGASGRLITSYYNGTANFAADWGTTSTAQTNSNVATIGYDARDTGASTSWFGDLSLVAVFGDGWTDDQHVLFARDPWDILRPSAPIIIGKASSGSAVTASIGLGSVQVTGLAPTVSAAVSAAIGAGSVQVLGLAPSVSAAATAAIGAGTVQVTGLAPSVSAAASAAIGAGAVTVTGLAPAVSAAVSASIGAGAVQVTGLAPAVTAAVGATAAIGAGSLQVTGLAPTVSAAATAAIGAGAVAVSGLAPTVSAAVTASVGAGSVQVTGLAPTVTATDTVMVGLGSIVVTGLAPVVSAAVSVSIGRGSVQVVGYAPLVGWAGWTPAAEPSGEWDTIAGAVGGWVPVAAPSGEWS